LRRCGKKSKIFHHVDCKILALEMTKKNSSLAKNQVATLHKGTFACKNVQNDGASLDSFFKVSWLQA